MKELSEQQLKAGWTEFFLVYRNAIHAGVDTLVGLRDAFEAAAEILAERQPAAPDEQAAPAPERDVVTEMANCLGGYFYAHSLANLSVDEIKTCMSAAKSVAEIYDKRLREEARALYGAYDYKATVFTAFEEASTKLLGKEQQ